MCEIVRKFNEDYVAAIVADESLGAVFQVLAMGGIEWVSACYASHLIYRARLDFENSIDEAIRDLGIRSHREKLTELEFTFIALPGQMPSYEQIGQIIEDYIKRRKKRKGKP